MNDEQLAEAARRLKAHTGAGFRRRPGNDFGYVDVEEMLASEMAQQMNAQLNEEMARTMYHGDYVDMVKRSDGVWCAPWDVSRTGASDDGNRQQEPGRTTGAPGGQPW